MQTLVSQLTITFVDDAIELLKGFGKLVVHIATAPIERIANACDVSGVLARRRLARRLRATTKAHRPRSPWKRSLFEHRMENDRPFPEDILLMVMQAFALMHEPMVRLLPGRNPEEVALLARMMFSAVHGIISLGLEERMVAVPPEKLRQQLAQFVDTHLTGLGIPLGKARDGEV